MTLTERLGGVLPRAPVTVDLDDIQATVLRYRPEPYYGTHVMLHVADAGAGREFVRRLAPHVDSAADWWQAGQSWISVGLSYAGLVALGVPQNSLDSFPDAFRAGMAGRADELRDYGENDPKHWDAPFGTGLVHLGVSGCVPETAMVRAPLAGAVAYQPGGMSSRKVYDPGAVPVIV